MAENWFVFILLYGIVNIVSLVAGVFWCYDEDGNLWNLLFFPKLWVTTREDWDLNVAGAIIVCVFAGLFFLPAILFGYACLIAFFLVAVFCVLFCEIFKKKDKRSKSKTQTNTNWMAEEDEKDFEEFCRNHICENCKYFIEKNCMEAFVHDKYHLN